MYAPKDPFYSKIKMLESGSRLRRTAAVIQQKFKGKKSEFFTDFIERSVEQRGLRVNINFYFQNNCRQYQDCI